VRPRTLVAGAALTAALALVALPGLAGSQTRSPYRPVEAAAFQAISIDASDDGSSQTIGPLDDALRSADSLTTSSQLIEPGARALKPVVRPKTVQPAVSAAFSIKPPRYTLKGFASFYDNGTTAMRLPRGTVIRICGPGGCVERVVNDYGPVAGTARIVDMYRPDFFAVCGCPSFSGTIAVSVGIY
jgi:hypothetical protein